MHELKLAGQFKLIYPSYNEFYYKQFFEEKREQNEFYSKLIQSNLGKIKIFK